MPRLNRLLPRTPAQVGARALTALGAAALVMLLTLSGVTTPLDDALFDLAAGSLKPATSPQVVVVAIDQNSQATSGASPWSRRELASLVDRLGAAGTRAIGLQLLLAQSSLYDPQGDALLAQAVARNGAVALPVIADAPAGPGSATAILPAPALVAAAAALGHTDAVIDRDGVARRLALHAGLGAPQWPAFALALKDLAFSSPGQRHPARMAAAAPADGALRSKQWIGADTVLLAYPDSAAAIPHLEAAAVMDGRAGVQALAGRIAIVGRTDPIPGQHLSQPGAPGDLSPVDFQANALANLLKDRAVWPIPTGPQMLLSVILVTLPLLLLGLPGLRRLWAPMAVAIALVLLVSGALLLAGAWFPPLPTVLVLAIGLATGTTMAWRRARLRSLTDPATGVANRQHFDLRLQRDTRRARREGQPLSLLLVEARVGGTQVPGGRGDLSNALAAGLRLRAQAPGDLIARLDVGRFAVLMPDTASHVAMTLATALMVDLEDRPRRSGNATAGQALRMGLASLQPEDSGAEDLLLRATRELVSTRDPTAHSV